MALKMNIETGHGITLPDSYVRIDEQSGSKEGISLRVRYYASKVAAENGKQWVQEEILTFVPSVEEDAANFLKQGYEYLKTLEEYTDAIDC